MVEILPTTPELTALRAAVRQIVDRYGFSTTWSAPARTKTPNCTRNWAPPGSSGCTCPRSTAAAVRG